MSKFKYISKKGQVSVILKTVSGEQINTGEAAYFAGNFFKGFLRPASDGSGRIIYTGGQGISLGRFLRRPVTKDQFFIIIAQLLEAYKTIVSVRLNPASVNLDPEVITINENTGEIYLVYQPILNLKSPNQGYMRCFAQICSMLRFASPADKAGVDAFVNFARQLSSFSVGDIENYIQYAAPRTYAIVQRRPMSVSPVNPVQPEPAAIPVQTPENVSAPEPVDPVQPEPAAVPVQTPEQPLSDFSPKKNIPETTGEEQSAVDPSSTAASAPENPDPALVEPIIRTAELIRRANGERIVIRNDKFVMGRERGSAADKKNSTLDYAISGNKTVSRVHATIYRRGELFVIVDNGSTNKTFINGSPIPPRVEIRLNSGDAVKLSDEEFEFTLT